MSFSTKIKKFNLFTIAGVILLFIVFGFLFYIYSIDISSLILIAILALYLHQMERGRNLPPTLDLALLVGLALLVVVFTVITFKLSPYAVSAVGFVILVTLLFDNLRLSCFFAILISVLAASTQQGEFGLSIAVSLFSGALIAALLSWRARNRFRIIRAGLAGGVVQFLVAIVAENGQSLSIFFYPNLELLKVSLANGIISGIVVLGVLPLFEYTFRVVTNISLLELSDFNHPVLKKMILEAPGTYQHSLVVANLAETAAETINANSLLARVGAYYHDIGKIDKPQYFVENQIPYRDMHKKLKPSISKMIIINHVKKGIELAKKYRLNPRIIDFIQQHHGKSLVYFFYRRAQEIEPNTDDKEEYRYPGPKPQTKEVALVSLADAVEAFSRTVEEPTPSRIEEMVREVVKRKFISGELDESDLTLKDLENITKSFVRILNAIFHTRINYPQDDSGKKYTDNPPPK